MTVAAVILAAGTASRYRASGGRWATKLVEPYSGVPLVRHVAQAALAATGSAIVVTGHAREAVEHALAGLSLRFVHNPDYASGLSTSLRAGLASLDETVAAAVILLGDMPLVSAATIRRLIEAAAQDRAAQAVLPVTHGVRGNPVLLRRSLFDAASRLGGDEGARRLLRDPDVVVLEVPMTGAATRFDIDEAGAEAPPVARD